MAPVPAPKKKSVLDGTIEQYPDSYLGATAHSTLRTCTDCHNGNDKATTRVTEARTTGGWVRRPRARSASRATATSTESTRPTEIHATLGGYVTILEGRGVDLDEGSIGPRALRSEVRGTATSRTPSSRRAAVGTATSRFPRVAGAGFINGHNFRKTPDMERQCTACHGSRVKAEFFGLNGDLTARNGLGVRRGGSRRPPAVDARQLNSDGYEKGCTFCHGADEMHGFGAPKIGAGGPLRRGSARLSATTATDPTDDPGFDSQAAHTDPPPGRHELPVLPRAGLQAVLQLSRRLRRRQRTRLLRRQRGRIPPWRGRPAGSTPDSADDLPDRKEPAWRQAEPDH